MVKLHSKCEKCHKDVYPVYYRDKEKKFKTIFHKHKEMGKIKRVYWCPECKRFWHRFV